MWHNIIQKYNICNRTHHVRPQMSQHHKDVLYFCIQQYEYRDVKCDVQYVYMSIVLFILLLLLFAYSLYCCYHLHVTLNSKTSSMGCSLRSSETSGSSTATGWGQCNAGRFETVFGFWALGSRAHCCSRTRMKKGQSWGFCKGRGSRYAVPAETYNF